MSVAQIKQELHTAIDRIESEELLQAMLVILAQGNYHEESYLTEEQLQLLKEREEAYIKGESKAHTLEEFQEKMNKKYGV